MGIKNNTLKVFAVFVLFLGNLTASLGATIIISEKLSNCEGYLILLDHSFFLLINSWNWFSLFIGIDVKKGRGRYIDTCMVIFAPRYLLDNKSSHKLAFAQREFARGQVSSLLLKNDECLFNSTVNFNVI